MRAVSPVCGFRYGAIIEMTMDHILVIDDDETFNAVLCRALKRRGFDAEGVRDPQAALQAAAQAVHAQGEIYLEAPAVWSDEALAPLGLQVHRQGKAGAVAFHLLRPIARV